MLRKLLYRFMNGFCYSIAITMVIHALIMRFTATPQLLPEFRARFDSDLTAYMTELFLIGFMSAVTSAGTVIFEARKISLLAQSILHLLIMLCAWIPVSCFVWGFHRYVGSMISTVSGIVVTYGLCWWLQYRSCRRDIEEINAKLLQRGE